MTDLLSSASKFSVSVEPVSRRRVDVAIAADAIVAAQQRMDAARRLPADLVDTLRAADLFRLFTPREHGGLELDPDTACAAIEDVARHDASVGWCVWNGNLGFAAALLAPGPSEEVFGSGAPVGNSARVGGAALEVEGGFRLTGTWDLVSGSDHQPWMVLFGVVSGADGPRFVRPGVVDLRAFFVRQAQCRIVDRWHVLGLRGTASNTVVVEDEFVPAGFAPAPFDPPRIDRTLFRIPVFTTSSCGAAAVCLGIARGAIDDLTVLAATKSSIRGPEPIAASPEVQAAVARCDIELRAARAALHDALDVVTRAAAEAVTVTLAERGTVRAAMTHAAITAKAVTLRMFELGSSAVIYDDHPLQRRLRDVLVAAQHVMVQPLWFEEAGRTRLGLEPTLPVL